MLLILLIFIRPFTRRKMLTSNIKVYNINDQEIDSPVEITWLFSATLTAGNTWEIVASSNPNGLLIKGMKIARAGVSNK